MKVIVLDFNTGNVCVLDFDSSKYDSEDIATFFDDTNKKHKTHFKESECQWMIVDKLTIEII